MAVHAFEWQQKAERLLLNSEVNYILGTQRELDRETGAYLAYLVQAGILPSREEADWMNSYLSRGDVVLYLSRMIKTYQDFVCTGIFKGYDQDQVAFEKEGETVQLDFSPSVYLLRNHGENTSFVRELHLLGGEELRWIEKNGQLILVEVVYPPYTNVLDRSSKYHSWQVRQSREELSQRINQFFPIGELMDMVPQKWGVSNRVIELLIKGSENQVVVKGLRIRRTLGLREVLFVMDREYDDDGRVSHFIFNGRGWGHGVGLCQVGAFGMAQMGMDYKDILKKYYHGIKIDKVY